MQRTCNEVDQPKMAGTQKTDSLGKNVTLLPGIPDSDTQHLQIDLPDHLIARLRERN